MSIPSEIIKEIIQVAPMTTFRLFMLSCRAYYAFCKSILPDKMKRWEIKQIDEQGNTCISFPNSFKLFEELNYQKTRKFYKSGQLVLETQFFSRDRIDFHQKTPDDTISFTIRNFTGGYRLVDWSSAKNEEFVYNCTHSMTWNITKRAMLEIMFLDNFDIYQFLDSFAHININIVTKKNDNYDFCQVTENQGLSYYIRNNHVGIDFKICLMTKENWAELESKFSPEMFNFIKRQIPKCCRPEISPIL